MIVMTDPNNKGASLKILFRVSAGKAENGKSRQSFFMKYFLMKRNLFSLVLAAMFILPGCNKGLIATYDQYAYTQTTTLKVDVLDLIDKSTESYSSHLPEIESVTSDLKKILEYEKHRPLDGITLRMWQKMIDETGEGGIIGRYLKDWREHDKKLPAMVTEYKGQVAEGFDMIAELETKKIKNNDQKVQSFLNK
jgi:hypothetical protein